MQTTGTIAYLHPLTRPIDVKVEVPGSKSYTNRALIIAALANGITALRGVSDSNDSKVLISLLKQLGVDINEEDNVLYVTGCGGKFRAKDITLNVEDAGTVMRFMTALCCLVPAQITLEGSERMHQRPIRELVDALAQLGAQISYLGKVGYPPIKIMGGTIKGGRVKVNGSISSQFVSALLMIAPLLELNTEIIVEGEQVSEPYIEMTIGTMFRFGISVKKRREEYIVTDYQSYNFTDERFIYKAVEYDVEGDASSASYLYAIAALSQSKITVTNVPILSKQSDAFFPYILRGMGCTINGIKYWEVTGPPHLRAWKDELDDMPDVAQTLAVIAAFAEGETFLTGLKTLQIKETERLTALKIELTKMGIECETGNDYIKIKGGKPKGVIIDTYNDHRMAMAFAVAGTKIEGIGIRNPGVVKKSFPQFWNTLKLMGINVELR